MKFCRKFVLDRCDPEGQVDALREGMVVVQMVYFPIDSRLSTAATHCNFEVGDADRCKGREAGGIRD